MKWWILGIGTAGLLTVLIANWKAIVFLAWMLFFASSMCGNYVAQETLSPDSEHRAVVFQRDCGAATGFSTQISIVDASDDLPNEAGNVFIAPGHPDTTATTLHWKDAKTLVVTTAAMMEATRTEQRRGDIAVEYVVR